jgi:hypothetical protein
VLNEPAMRERLVQLGALQRGLSIEDSRRFFAEETRKWTRVIQAANIRAD